MEHLVLAAREPDAPMLLAAAAETNPDLWIRLVREDSVFEFCAAGDAEAAPVLRVESPVLVAVPGELTRLLGPAATGPSPLWWVEIRSTVDGSAAAGRLAAELADRTGGRVWTFDA